MNALKRSRTLGALMLATSMLFGCEATDSPTAVGSPDFAIGDYSTDSGLLEPGVALVCAFYPEDEAYAPATFEVTATGGDAHAGNFSIPLVPQCFEAWNSTDATLALVTASLVDVPDNLVLDRIVWLVGEAPEVTTYYDVTSATAGLSDLIGGNVWFKFERFDTPPDNGGGEGCTPGYWRQEHHFDSWTGYAPSDLFSSVFADAFPGQTLLDVVWARGGGLNALGRSAVAALLNATSPGVSYDYTAAEVIDLFNAAYASGDRTIIENQKNVFDFLNNQGCGLN
jgi:hypothetical protein